MGYFWEEKYNNLSKAQSHYGATPKNKFFSCDHPCEKKNTWGSRFIMAPCKKWQGSQFFNTVNWLGINANLSLLKKLVSWVSVVQWLTQIKQVALQNVTVDELTDIIIFSSWEFYMLGAACTLVPFLQNLFTGKNEKKEA